MKYWILQAAKNLKCGEIIPCLTCRCLAAPRCLIYMHLSAQGVCKWRPVFHRKEDRVMPPSDVLRDKIPHQIAQCVVATPHREDFGYVAVSRQLVMRQPR